MLTIMIVCVPKNIYFKVVQELNISYFLFAARFMTIKLYLTSKFTYARETFLNINANYLLTFK